MLKIKSTLLSFFMIIALLSMCTVEAFASKPPIVPTSHHADCNSSKLEKSTRTRPPSPPKKNAPKLNLINSATFANDQQTSIHVKPESSRSNNLSSAPLPLLPERNMLCRNSNNFSNSMHNRQMAAPEISSSIVSSTPTRSLPSVPKTKRSMPTAPKSSLNPNFLNRLNCPNNHDSAVSTDPNTTTEINLLNSVHNMRSSTAKAANAMSVLTLPEEYFDLDDEIIEIAPPSAVKATSASISSEEDFDFDVEIIEIVPAELQSSQLFINSSVENGADKKDGIAAIEKEIINALETIENLSIDDIHKLLNTIYKLHGCNKVSTELQNKIKELLKKIITRFIELGTVTETIIGLCTTMDALSILSATNVSRDVIEELMNNLANQFADFIKNKPLVFEDFYERPEDAINQIKLFIEKLKDTQLLSEENLIMLDALNPCQESIVTQIASQTENELSEPNAQANRSFLNRLVSSFFPNSQREPVGNATMQTTLPLENEPTETSEQGSRSFLDRLASSLFPEYPCENPADCDPGLHPLSRSPFALPKSPK